VRTTRVLRPRLKNPIFSDKAPLDVVTASLATPLLPRLKNSIDVLLFNPPYVPTEQDEVDHAQSTADIQGSWAGGTDGMQVTDVLLRELPVGALSA
jgi:release factor glutamine methyltransferase